MSTLFSLGEAHRAAYDTEAARAAFRQGVETGERAIDAAATDASGRFLLSAGLYELSLISDPPEAKAALRRAVAILDDLKARDQLDPRFASWLDIFEQALRKLP